MRDKFLGNSYTIAMELENNIIIGKHFDLDERILEVELVSEWY